MPSAAPRPCTYPGCGVLVNESSRCLRHKPDINRASANDRGYGSAWRRARIAFLSDHPLCKACDDENKVSAATVVDHIIPHKGNQRLMWDMSNWQALCKPHHDRKTATEDGGFGR